MENFEKVEAYFNNEFSDSEKNDFLKEVETNTELKSEYDFQNEVINGIKEARKAELKAMLDKVPISSVSTTTTGLYKILAGGAATLVVGTAMWYYLNSTPEAELKNNEVVTTTPLNQEKTISDKIIDESIATTSELEKSIVKKSSKAVSQKNKPSVITPNVPVVEDEIANQSLPEENLEIPDDISKTTINISSKVNVEIKLKKKYSFHYQFTDGNLVLYGNFEEGLFEVLELNKGDRNEVYLFYKNNYYFIKDDSGSIVPLRPIMDINLKQKLERIR